MATIEELYKQSGFAKLADKSKDKTPLSVDSKKLQKDEQAIAKARGGTLLEKKYSDTIKR